jgi:F0F1-type ATP synthase membrane subunit a
MATEAHAAEGATGYIVHHLTPLSVGEGFWSLHLDTLFFSAVLGALFVWFFKVAEGIIQGPKGVQVSSFAKPTTPLILIL